MRKICFFVIAFMILSLASAFAGGGGETETTADGKIPLRMLAAAEDHIPGWSDPDYRIYQEIAKAGNFDLEVVMVPWPTEYDTKLATLLVSGDLPDIMYMSTLTRGTDLLHDFGPQGLFLAFDDHFDKMPNFQKVMERHPEYYDKYRSPDGNHYAIPGGLYDIAAFFSGGLVIRGDILNQGGMEVEDIETIDDLYDALTIVKDITGKPPWGSRAMGNWMYQAAPIFGTWYRAYYNGRSDSYQFGPFDENFEVFLEFMHKAYQDGLVYPDIANMSDQDWEQSVMNDDTHFFIDNMMQPPRLTPKEAGETMSYFLPPLVNGVRYFGTRGGSPMITGRFWTVNPETKVLDNILELFDWGYSEEGTELLVWGEEGVHFRWSEDRTYREWNVEEGEDFNSAANKLIDEHGLNNNQNLWVYPLDRFLAEQYGDYFPTAYKYYADNDVVMAHDPSIVFNESEFDSRMSLESAINTYVDENVAKFILGRRPLSEYDDFKDELKELGAETLLANYQSAYKRYIGE